MIIPAPPCCYVPDDDRNNSTFLPPLKCVCLFQTSTPRPSYRTCHVFFVCFLSQSKAGGRRPRGGRALCAQGPRQEGGSGQGSASARKGRKAAPPEYVSPVDPGDILDVSGSSLRAEHLIEHLIEYWIEYWIEYCTAVLYCTICANVRVGDVTAVAYSRTKRKPNKN